MYPERFPLLITGGCAWPKSIGAVQRPGIFDGKQVLAGDLAIDRLWAAVDVGVSMSVPMLGGA